jgi:hypothetical protein
MARQPIRPAVPVAAAVSMLEAAGWTVQHTGTTFWGFVQPDGTRLRGQQCNLTSAFELLCEQAADR